MHSNKAAKSGEVIATPETVARCPLCKAFKYKSNEMNVPNIQPAMITVFALIVVFLK